MFLRISLIEFKITLILNNIKILRQIFLMGEINRRLLIQKAAPGGREASLPAVAKGGPARGRRDGR